MKVKTPRWSLMIPLVIATALLFGCSKASTPGGTGSTSISAISPNTGSTSGGTAVTISGNNLQSGDTVTFGGIAATSVNVVDSTKMTAVTPAHSAGSVDVVVTGSNGKSAKLAQGFGYGTAPAISSVSPNSGPTAGGTTVNIAGKHFATGALVFFGAVAATGITVASSTQIQATTPSVSSAAAVAVVVQNSDGQSGSLANGFTYTDAPPNSSPTVSSVSPSTVSPGSSVTIDGSSFGSGAAVTVGSTAASSVQFLNSTQLAATVPSVSPGTYDLTVANTNGLSATLPSALTVADPKSLLHGCTVNASNQPVCGSNVGSAAIPSGWTLADAEGFESGSLANSSIESTHGGSVECTFAHSGSCGFGYHITSDGANGYWMLSQSAIGSSQEVYVSWWEYLDPVARMNMEMFIANIGQCCSNPDVVFDNYDAGTCLNGNGPGGTYNCENAETVTAYHPTDIEMYKGVRDLPLGSWAQYELHFVNNTSGQANGSAQLYINGVLQSSWSNVNWSNSTAVPVMSVQVGGIYSAIAFTDSTGTNCEANHGSSTSHYCNPFSNCTPCPIPANFNRYWDDIIVLKR